MEKNEIIEKLNTICKEVFEDETFELDESMTVGDVDGWTSLTNMMLIAEVEKSFGFKFKLRELGTLDNIGAFIIAIQSNTQP